MMRTEIVETAVRISHIARLPLPNLTKFSYDW